MKVEYWLPRTSGSLESKHLRSRLARGLILLRLPRESRQAYLALIDSLLDRVDLSQIPGCTCVVSPGGVRIHRNAKV